MKISSIICTHNGQKVLGKAIQSLVNQTLAKEDYEILVVDNGSTDNTCEIASQFQNQPNLRYIFESKLGLSHARNTGYKEARGDIIAYLDDDAIACSKWLELIVEVFQTVPNVGAVGGKVNPIWEVDPPTWINDFMQRYLSVLNWSETPIVLDDSKYLVGANISFQRKNLEKFSGFSTNLGRKGKNLISSEETELVNKIKGDGQSIFYHPEISVNHLVPAARMNSSWFRRRWFTQGISSAILYRSEKFPTAREKRNYTIKILKNILRRPQNLILAAFPSVFPNAAARSHNSLAGLGFIYGLFKADV
jgi:glycosyltransferase involved in cell wall biosynthesis